MILLYVTYYLFIWIRDTQLFIWLFRMWSALGSLPSHNLDGGFFLFFYFNIERSELIAHDETAKIIPRATVTILYKGL